MTAICPGNGPSGPLPNTPAIVAVTSAAIESALILAGQPEAAALLAPFLVANTFNTATFCTQDPPGDPGLTVQDMFDLLNYQDFTRQAPAVRKFEQWFDNWYWYKLCG